MDRRCRVRFANHGGSHSEPYFAGLETHAHEYVSMAPEIPDNDATVGWALPTSSPNIVPMIPILHLSRNRLQVDALLKNLRLDPVELSLSRGSLAAASQAVQKILNDVAERGDEAIVAIAKQFDDPNFSADQIRVSAAEMEEASKRIPKDQRDAIRRSISQVREYQAHIMPKAPMPLNRPGVE